MRDNVQSGYSTDNQCYVIISFQRLEERIENQNVLIVAKIHGYNIYGKCETDVKINYKSFWKMAGYYFKSYRDIYI